MHRFFVLLAALVWAAVFVVRTTASAPPPADAPAVISGSGETTRRRRCHTPGETQQAGYVGQDTCATCHNGYDTSINATEARTGEEPAHAGGGTGVRDAATGRAKRTRNDPEKVKPLQFDQDFSQGSQRHLHHLPQPRRARALERQPARSAQRLVRQLPQHPQAEVDDGAVEGGRTSSSTCITCHRDKVAKLDKSGHMPVREGKMECSSCHNPHGSTNVRLLKTGNIVNEACSSCHAEKRGPYLFEHAGINGESCATCHDPHGSNNDRMLVAKLPFLCQRCHNHTRHPSTIYDNKVAAEQQPAVQPQLRHVSLGDPRLEPSGRFDVPAAVAEADHATAHYALPLALLLAAAPRRVAQDPPSLPAPDRSGGDRPQRVHRQVVRHGRLRRPRHVDRRRRSARAALSRSALGHLRQQRCSPGAAPQDWTLEAQAWNIGYRDQRYQLDFAARRPADGVVPAAIRSRCASAATRRRLLRRDAARRVPPRGLDAAGDPGRDKDAARLTRTRRCSFDLRTMRKIGQADVVFNANAQTDIIVTGQEHQPRRPDPVWRAPSASATPSRSRCRSTRAPPTCRRRSSGPTTSGMVRVGWDGSTFDNNIDSVVWDNPLRYGPDIVGGPSQGRMALVAGQHADLRARHRRRSASPRNGRLTGYVAFGQGTQQRGPAAVHHQHGARSPCRSSRQTAEAKQQMTIAQFTFAMRPTRLVALNASYRYADVDVQTPVFERDTRIGVLRHQPASPARVRPSITA